MKKITFRRCTVMAAVFAACLFAAGCKPNQPNPAPNPEPAPNPAPNPAPKPAPSPSIEVPIPDTPPVVPGGTVQEETIPNPYPPTVETVNVKVKLQSIAIPTTSGESYGISQAYKDAQTYIIPVDKAVVDVDLKRAEKMQELLLLMLKTKGLGDCKLYKTAAGDAPDISNFLKNGSSTVFVGEPRRLITVDSDGTNSVMFDKIAPASPAISIAEAGKEYVVPKSKYDSIIGTNVQLQVFNTDTSDERRAQAESAIKRFLDSKIGAGKYLVFKTATATPFASSDADYSANTGSGIWQANKKIFIGIKEEPINKTLTVKPITANITIGGDNYTASALGAYPSTVSLGGVTTATVAADIKTQLTAQFEASLGTGNFANYKLFCKGAPAATDELNGSNLEGDIIYIGKK